MCSDASAVAGSPRRTRRSTISPQTRTRRLGGCATARSIKLPLTFREQTEQRSGIAASVASASASNSRPSASSWGPSLSSRRSAISGKCAGSLPRLPARPPQSQRRKKSRPIQRVRTRPRRPGRDAHTGTAFERSSSVSTIDGRSGGSLIRSRATAVARCGLHEALGSPASAICFDEPERSFRTRRRGRSGRRVRHGRGLTAYARLTRR